MNPISEAAKNLPGHWHKGGLTDGHGNHCGIGHVKVACGYDVLDINTNSEWWRAIQFMHKVVREQYPGLDFFSQLNDGWITTEAEVLAVMDKAAVLWDERV
jgi:hypothetical protein